MNLAVWLLLAQTVVTQIIPVQWHMSITNDKNKIQVIISNGPGNERDFVMITPAGTPDSKLVSMPLDSTLYTATNWRYLDGTTDKMKPRAGLKGGTIEFPNLDPGGYEVRFYIRPDPSQAPILKFKEFHAVPPLKIPELESQGKITTSRTANPGNNIGLSFDNDGWVIDATLDKDAQLKVNGQDAK